jgi:hypothetical protein
MTVPYRAHVNERTLLNLPGFHSGAFATSTSRTRANAASGTASTASGLPVRLRRQLRAAPDARALGLRQAHLARVRPAQGGLPRELAPHKLDTLVVALRVFREALLRTPGGAASRSPGPPDTVAERRGARLQSAYTAVRVCPVSLQL